MKKIILTAITFAFLAACATDPYTGESKTSNTAKGAAIGTLGGAAAGAGIGAIAGGGKGTWIGAIAGAGAGALLGGGTGAYMDVQAKKLRAELQGTGVQVAQEGNRVHLIMPGNITFSTNEANIRSSFEPVLNSVSKVIKEFDKTMVQIIGYTDNTGSAATNNALSLRRANAVSNYLRLQGVDGNRLIVDGLGAQNPIASNASATGREQNRRVEITLINRQ
ncbi:MAG: OmpA family protein [Lactobacillales bacterium]|jgi:outer membrane protein OmpA-like peptidoglycan-associated protein|nr:OmpA family protein [Lactobacillales bacterium]